MKTRETGGGIMKIHEVAGEPCVAVRTRVYEMIDKTGDSCRSCPLEFKKPCCIECERVHPTVSTVFVRVPDYVALQLQGHFLETF